MIVLEMDQAVLDLRIGDIGPKMPGRADDAVARNHDRAGIRFEHFDDVFHGDPEVLRQFLVIGEFAVRNGFLDVLVELHFLLVSHGVDREIERFALTEQVLVDLEDRFHEKGVFLVTASLQVAFPEMHRDDALPVAHEGQHPDVRLVDLIAVFHRQKCSLRRL